MNPTDALILKAGPQRYAVPAGNVRQIVHTAALVNTPDQPTVLAGFLNFRGAAIPVIRLRQLFRFEASKPSIYSPLVIIEAGGLTAALEADAVDDVVEIDGDSIRKLGENDSPNHCAEGVFTADGRDVILLSCASLLLDKEKECLRELQAVVERRLLELGRAAE